MDIMKPIASTEIPTGNEWMYEIKYDGFRCLLEWGHDSIRLISRNNKELTGNFPEIIEFCKKTQPEIAPMLPLMLDGELVVLNNPFQANFPWIQKRGRLKNKDTINKAAASRPVSFLAFDILMNKGGSCMKKPYQDRKAVLEKIFSYIAKNERIRMIEAYANPDDLWGIIFQHKSEGMIAKRKKSFYQHGKNHHDWFKIKNWRTIQGFLTFYDPNNHYFSVNVYKDKQVKEIGKCKHGLDTETFQTLQQVFLKNGEKEVKGYNLPPAICASLYTLDLHQNELREPEFAAILPESTPEECTLSKLQLAMAMLPENVELTNMEKVFWPAKNLTKGDLLIYMREIAPYMLPFLKNRALTIIRSPDGVEAEFFFQKHLPAYAPEFIDSIQAEDEKLILCNDLDSLIWFANHGAVEYHTPFQTADHTSPDEIVFDLDPPDRKSFDLAIQAANLIKPLLDDLELVSFVKTSGKKGLQIHLPIPAGSMSYDETAVITEAIARTIETAYPDLFTTERMKKNRNNRLYIDYVQHGKDKTLIAAYSPRKTTDATVATPLFWEEVTEGLRPEQFTITNTVERVQHLGCPFKTYFDAGEKQNLSRVMKLVK
ncbi:DNA ligase D [Virgibacillus indicus]|uniref:DNA ligase (ATP) n=1 Tax=Virgibacillus indicus TaxID=2024554 RepID=A0A265NAL6_9BACI|nr:DNA ligase D [Virgibacillus indicus]OZU88499.1 DNA ligase D [Virgibacillus indicus]